jgi:hypothetical protein
MYNVIKYMDKTDIIVISTILLVGYLFAINTPIADAYHAGFSDGAIYNDSYYKICTVYVDNYTINHHLDKKIELQSLYSIYPYDLNEKSKCAYAMGYINKRDAIGNKMKNLN